MAFLSAIHVSYKRFIGLDLILSLASRINFAFDYLRTLNKYLIAYDAMIGQS